MMLSCYSCGLPCMIDPSDSRMSLRRPSGALPRRHDCRMHADCEFRNLGRELSVAHSTGSPMTFLDTDFVENDVPYDDYAMVSGWNDDTVITLENCTFDGNTGPNTFFMYSNATVYASGLRGLEAPVVFVDDETEANVTVPALAQAPQGRALQAADPWFTAVKEVRPGPAPELRN